MAIVPLTPIGSPRDTFIDAKTFDEHRTTLTGIEDHMREQRVEVHAGWGDKYVARVHDKGKLTTRERLRRLADPDSPMYEVGTFANHGLTFGAKNLRSPAAGVVTIFARVHDRWCMVIANDNTVASGSWWPLTPEKIQRAQTMALRLRIPTIYLVDCSGLYLPEQSKSFPGARGAGHIFKMNSLLSDSGVPQLAGVFGDCIAGGGYMPIISDRVYMTEQAYMVIAGAALIKGAKSQKITSLDIGGPEIHVHRSGCADVRVPDDDVLIECLRRDVAKLPSSAADYYRGDAGVVDTAFPTHELCGIVPPDHREPYDATQVLARLCDQSLFWELMSDTGREMICGVGRIGGLYAGFIVNRQGLVSDPEHTSKQRPAAILYRAGIAKIAAFSRACNDDGIPIIWLQDISGFDVGLEAEAQGLLGFGSSLIYTNSTNQVPMFTVLLRKASGAGYYAMSGLPYDPVVQLSTCIARLSVMEGKTLAIATFNSKLDDDFEIVSTDAAEREQIEQGMADVAERIEKDMDPYVSARQLDTDELVAVGELRGYLSALVEMSYQSIGYRRIKNSRIWSLHDLDVLTTGVRE
jgi:3-methylcrotonyl-CoA carboxylase beta subunit